jgi:uncharacterized MAPEG superfamily protein
VAHNEEKNMTIELQMLLFSVILGLVHIAVAATLTVGQYGARWSASARDAVMPPLQGVAARTDRALKNFLETFVLFAAAVLATRLSGVEGGLAALGAQLYFWARLIYLPVYALGIPYLRSLIWTVATAGIVLVLVAALG